MDKLHIVVVSDKQVSTLSMAGCGRNNPSLCGSRECDFIPNAAH